MQCSYHQLYISECKLYRFHHVRLLFRLIQMRELEAKLTEINETNKRLYDLLNMFIEKQMNCSSPTEEQQNAASPTKKRKLDDSLTISSDDIRNERTDINFRKESPSSKGSFKRFYEEINPKDVTTIHMRSDPANSSLVSRIR